MEIWKDIQGYEGIYQISSWGNVKSFHKGQEKILKLNKDKDGYLRVTLYKEGKQKNFKVHRLVATAFLDNTDNLPCVNHKDEDKENNRVENLEFCTYEYNINYGTRNARASKKIICITTNMVFNSVTEASKFYNINKGNICECCKYKRKSSGKYNDTPLVWRYLDIIEL